MEEHELTSVDFIFNWKDAKLEERECIWRRVRDLKSAFKVQYFSWIVVSRFICDLVILVQACELKSTEARKMTLYSKRAELR